MKKRDIQSCMRIVVKVDLSEFMHDSGKMNYARMENLIRVISDFVQAGKEVAIVGSGAMKMGLHKLKQKHLPASVQEKQAIAAVGQCELMRIYNKLFAEQNCIVGQVLLTKGIIENERVRQNVTHTFEVLFANHIIPIVDGNDTVEMDAVANTAHFGETNYLTSIIKELVGADIVLQSSDIIALHTLDEKGEPY